ncbi:phosphatase PAP2 family protein [Candidatus Woesearchaeota archaeon]|nr:phosphatase PAP2 family protein [Candidatus Woesearchaeota archaeon]
MKKIGFEIKLIGLLFVLSALSFLLDDYAIRFSSFIKNSFFDVILYVFSTNLFLFVGLLLATSFYLYSKGKNILPLWLTFGITWVLSYALKFMFQRVRPGEMMTIFGFQDYSFPSTHAVLAFAVLGVIDEEFREIMWAWLAVAVLTAVSRVYFSYHYLSDVMFGALVGYSVGVIIVRYLPKIL